MQWRSGPTHCGPRALGLGTVRSQPTGRPGAGAREDAAPGASVARRPAGSAGRRTPPSAPPVYPVLTGAGGPGGRRCLACLPLRRGPPAPGTRGPRGRNRGALQIARKVITDPPFLSSRSSAGPPYARARARRHQEPAPRTPRARWRGVGHPPPPDPGLRAARRDHNAPMCALHAGTRSLSTTGPST